MVRRERRRVCRLERGRGGVELRSRGGAWRGSDHVGNGGSIDLRGLIEISRHTVKSTNK